MPNETKITVHSNCTDKKNSARQLVSIQKLHVLFTGHVIQCWPHYQSLITAGMNFHAMNLRNPHCHICPVLPPDQCNHNPNFFQHVSRKTTFIASRLGKCGLRSDTIMLNNTKIAAHTNYSESNSLNNIWNKSLITGWSQLSKMMRQRSELGWILMCISQLIQIL